MKKTVLACKHNTRLAVLFVTMFSYIVALIFVRNLAQKGDIFNQILYIAGFGSFLSIFLLVYKRKKFYNLYEKIISVLLIAFIFSFFSSFFLLNIDRSRSFYVIEWTAKDLISKQGTKIDLHLIKSPEALNQMQINFCALL